VINRKLHWAKTNDLDLNSVYPNLQADKNEAEELRIRFRDRVRQKRADRKLRLRLTVKVNSKQFWALVRRAERKRGGLSAIRDEHGNLLTNRELVERIVLEQLALIFSGKQSPIFSYRDEQLIRAAQTTEDHNWKDWIVPENNADMYKEEVCSPVTASQVRDVIMGLRRKELPESTTLQPQCLSWLGQAH